MNMISQEFRFCDRPSLVQHLGDWTLIKLQRALQQNERALLVVSGGSTPAPLFDYLSQQRIDWSRVVVTLADERWVDENHADSNARLVRQRLLVNSAAVSTFLPLYNGADSPEAGQPALQDSFDALDLAPTVTLLGMGDDMHTASLFPDAPELTRCLDRKNPNCCAAVNPTQAPWPRMTLTLPALLKSRNLAVMLNGESKWNSYQQALSLADAQQAPIYAVLAGASRPVNVFWAG